MRRHTVAAVLTATLTACRDVPTTAIRDSGTALALPDSPSFMIACDGSATGCADNGDTHVSADVTFSTSYTSTTAASFVDPVTGATTNVLSITTPPLRTYVEAGYLPDGTPRVTTGYYDGADPATRITPQVVRQDLTGDALAELNVNDAQLSFNPPSELAAASPMTLVGSTANGDITAGWLVDIADTIVSAQSLQTGTAGATRQLITIDQKLMPAAAFAAAQRGEVRTAVLNGIEVRVRWDPAGLIVAEDARDQAEMTPDGNTGRFSSTRAHHERRYRRFAKHWVLVEDASDIEIEDVHGKRHHRIATSLSKVRYFINARKDSARRAVRPTTDWIPLAVTTSASAASSAQPGFRLAPTTAHRFVACDESCQGGYSAPNAYPAALGNPPPCDPDNVAFTVAPPENADVNLLFQHGFKSTLQTWCQGSDYLRSMMRVGYELRHTLNWKSSYEEQAESLNAKFEADLVERPGTYVLVGHSNGGRINRYMAQSRQAANVRAVVTLSSPHAGAYLANLDQTVLLAAVGVPFAYGMSGCDLSTTFVCSQYGQYGAQVLAVVGPLLLQAAVPVTKQMGTDATFAQTIDARGDVGYRTAGVQNRLWDRWTLWRLLGDNQACDAYSLVDCDAVSANYVRTADRTYHGYIKCSIVSGLFGIVWPAARNAARACASNAGKMRAIDYAYKRLSVGSAHGDGIVPEHSQLYPGSGVQVLVDDSNSHIGETRSHKSALGIADAISQVANVPLVH